MKKTETEYKMYDIIVTKDCQSNVVIGQRTIKEEFEVKQYIPSTVSNLVYEKVANDYNTIKKALDLIAFYKSKGLTDFDFELNNILKIKEHND